jgi:hypothetical protein
MEGGSRLTIETLLLEVGGTFPTFLRGVAETETQTRDNWSAQDGEGARGLRQTLDLTPSSLGSEEVGTEKPRVRWAGGIKKVVRSERDADGRGSSEPVEPG